MNKNLPENFNWEHYVILNPFEYIKPDPTEAGDHYLRIGKRRDLPYHFNDIKIMIYSAPKTASTSLHKSFSKIINNKHIFHTHNNIPIFDSKYSIINIINIPRNEKLLILSCYREPISRAISTFFENITFYFNKTNKEILKLEYKIVADKLISFLKNHGFGHPFLENNKKNFDNIDIFKKAFNRVEGYQTYETKLVKIIMLRFDKINNFEKIIKQNTGYNNFHMLAENISSNKYYKDFYKKINNEIIIPKKILDRIYASEKDNMEYFYTDMEIKQIKNKWYDRLK